MTDFPSGTIVRCASELDALRQAVRRECRFIDTLSASQRQFYTDESRRGKLVRVTFEEVGTDERNTVEQRRNASESEDLRA